MTDTGKFEKRPMLTGQGTGICCIWQAVYKKDAALQARQHSFANASRQPISMREREAHFLDLFHLWLLWWDQSTFGLLYQQRLCIQALGLCWACSICRCLVTDYVHELIWAPAAGRIQHLEQGAGVQHGCIVSPAVLPWMSHQVFCWFWDTTLKWGCG